MQSKDLPMNYYSSIDTNFVIKKSTSVNNDESTHYHDFYQIYFVTRGYLTFYYLGKTKSLGKDDLFIVPPQASHHKVTSHNAEFYAINFFSSLFSTDYKNDDLTGFLTKIEKDSKGAAPNWPQVILPHPLRDTIEGFFQLLYDEFTIQREDGRHVIFGIMVALLSLLSRSYCMLPELQENSFMDNAAKKDILLYIDFLKSNFQDPVTLHSAIEATSLSKTLFCKLFCEIAGMSFHHYLNKLRIDHAAKLMVSTNIPLAVIAGKSGFGDFSTFYRNFTRIMGMTPRKYRSDFFAHDMEPGKDEEHGNLSE